MGAGDTARLPVRPSGRHHGTWRSPVGLLPRAAFGAAVSAPLNSPSARCADLDECASAHLNGVSVFKQATFTELP